MPLLLALFGGTALGSLLNNASEPAQVNAASSASSEFTGILKFGAYVGVAVGAYILVKKLVK